MDQSKLFAWYLDLKEIHTSPCMKLFRYSKNHSMASGEDAIAKIMPDFFEQCKISTNVFETPSTRGAISNHFNVHGVDNDFIHARGWASGDAYEKHYARAHQQCDCKYMLQCILNSTLGNHGDEAPKCTMPRRAMNSYYLKPKNKSERAKNERLQKNILSYPNRHILS